MMSQKYTVNLFSTYLQQIISIMIPLVLTPLMVKHLGQDVYGLWVLVGSLIGYFNLSNFGFGTTLLKELSHQEDPITVSRYISTVFGFFGILALILFPIALTVAYFYPVWFDITCNKDTFSLFMIVFFIFVINLLFNTFGTVLFAKGYLVYKNFISIVGYLVIGFGVGFVLSKGIGILGVAIVYFLSSIVVAGLSYMYAKKQIRFKVSKQLWDKRILVNMTSDSLYYFLISLSVVIVFNTDNIVISSYLTLEAVALYAIGFKLVNISQNVLFKIVDILVPDISKLYAKKEYKDVLKLHNKMQFYTLLLASIGYGLLYFIGLDIIKLWVGEANVLPKDVFSVMLAFAFVHSWIHTSGMFLNAIGKHKNNAYYALGEAGLNIILSLVLIKYYGLFGVALGTVLSSLLTTAWLTPAEFFRQIKANI